MPKEMNDITKQVMDRIHKDHVKMRPRFFFMLGSVASVVGLVLMITTSVFLISIMQLSLRAGGRMAEYKLETVLSLFHWWIPAGALFGLVVGIWIMRQYAFSYKKNFLLIAIGFVLAIFIAGYTLDKTGLNEVMTQKGPMRELVKPYQEGGGYRGGAQDGSGRLREI